MARMAFSLSRLFSKRLRVHLPLTSISGQHNFCTDKDLMLAKMNKPKDFLMQNLRQAGDSKEVFSIISNHHLILNQKHILKALESLFAFYKLENVTGNQRDILADPSFVELCSRLKRHARALELSEVIQAMKILSYLGVSSNSTIFQVLLQLIKENINNLNLQQIVFLDFILSKCRNNHLIDSLQLALPLVFQLHLPKEMDHDDISNLTDYFHYVSKNELPEKCVKSIVTGLLLYMQTNKIKRDTAKSIAWSLLDLNFQWIENHSCKKLFQNCLSIMADTIEDMTFNDVYRTLIKLREKFLLKENQFYHEEFLNACGDYVIHNDVSLDKSMKISHLLTRIAYTHFGILDYFSQELSAELDYLETCRPNVLFSYINSLSSANFKPKNWDKLQEHMFKNPVMDSNKTGMPWMRFAVELATLQTYNDGLLDRVFHEDFLDEYLSRDNSLLDHLQLLLLHQAVTAFYPQYNGRVLSNSLLRRCIDISCNRPVDNSIKAILETALGGPQYVASAVVMPNGQFVDHVIALRDGNFPIALSQQDDSTGPIKFEDLSIKQDFQVVCILAFHAGCYSMNSKRLRGIFDLHTRIIEKMGYAVVPINVVQIVQMQQSERIPYIMREIKMKYPSDHNISLGNQML